ncbi:MAG: PP2C family protein-serine/threonine phosphatase [Clostridia bacterium]|nr:PP2C family protein-serine/threonine phosphatase [Clostridia bacterium]
MIKDLNATKHVKKAFRSIRVKVNSAVLFCGVILLVFNLWLLTDSMSFVEKRLVNEQLESDLKLLRNELGENDGAKWHVQDGMLMIGDTPIGDGTVQNANDAPLQTLEGVSGSFYSCFIRTYNDAELGYDEQNKYQQGHYLRASISVTGLSGERLEGIYLDKAMADALEESPDGTLSHISYVGGLQIYTRYELLYDESGEAIGILCNGRTVESLDGLVRSQRTKGTILIVTMLIVMLLGLGGIVFTMLGAITKIKDRLVLIGTGEFPEEPLDVNTRDELEDVANCENDMVESLKEKERLGAELSLATDIQAHMLPSIFPAFPGHKEFDIYASMQPAKEVGGDFYDFFMLDSKHIAMVIADVSGKGVPAALFMVIAKTLIKNHAQLGLSPEQVFTTVNSMLCEGNEADLFVSAWMGVVDLESGMLTYTNAGHNPPVLKKADGSFEYLRSKPFLVLACMDGISYAKNELQLGEGDKLVLYTDGVTEATNINEELYGEERLQNFLNAHSGEDAKTLLESLRKDVAAFQGEADQFDDITILTFDFLKKFKNEKLKELEFAIEDLDIMQILGFVDSSLKDIKCPEEDASKISEVVKCVFSNFASYDQKEIERNAKLYILPEGDNKGAKIILAQRGFPFDPLSNEAIEGETADTNLGLDFMREAMDEVTYKYENGHNIIVIKKIFEN